MRFWSSPYLLLPRKSDGFGQAWYNFQKRRENESFIPFSSLARSVVVAISIIIETVDSNKVRLLRGTIQHHLKGIYQLESKTNIRMQDSHLVMEELRHATNWTMATTQLLLLLHPLLAVGWWLPTQNMRHPALLNNNVNWVGCIGMFMRDAFRFIGEGVT